MSCYSHLSLLFDPIMSIIASSVLSWKQYQQCCKMATDGVTRIIHPRWKSALFSGLLQALLVKGLGISLLIFNWKKARDDKGWQFQSARKNSYMYLPFCRFQRVRINGTIFASWKNSSLFSKSHSLSMHSTNNLAKSVSTPYHIILQVVILMKRS